MHGEGDKETCRFSFFSLIPLPRKERGRALIWKNTVLAATAIGIGTAIGTATGAEIETGIGTETGGARGSAVATAVRMRETAAGPETGMLLMRLRLCLLRWPPQPLPPRLFAHRTSRS